MTVPVPPDAITAARHAAETHVLHGITMWRVAANLDSPDGVKLTDTAIMARRQLIGEIIEAAAPVLRDHWAAELNTARLCDDCRINVAGLTGGDQS